MGPLTVWHEEHVLNKNEATTKNSNGLPIKEVPPLERNEGQITQPHHDVPYFRNILQSETEKLTSHCLEWDRKLELTFQMMLKILFAQQLVKQDSL